MENLYKLTGLNHSIETLHRVEFFVLLAIEKGQDQHSIDFTDYSCSEGTLLTIRKDQIHKFIKSKSLKGKMLLFTNDFIGSYLENIEAQKD